MTDFFGHALAYLDTTFYTRYRCAMYNEVPGAHNEKSGGKELNRSS